MQSRTRVCLSKCSIIYEMKVASTAIVLNNKLGNEYYKLKRNLHYTLTTPPSKHSRLREWREKTLVNSKIFPLLVKHSKAVSSVIPVVFLGRLGSINVQEKRRKYTRHVTRIRARGRETEAKLGRLHREAHALENFGSRGEQRNRR